VPADPRTTALLRDALAAERAVLSGIGDADLARPTPCTGWDLRALVAHVVGQQDGFAAAIAAGDATAAAYAPRPAPDAAGLLRLWDASAERLLAACTGADGDRRVRLVEISADTAFRVTAAVRFQLLDTVVHTWDAATSLGHDSSPAPEVLAVVAEVAAAVPGGSARTAPGAAFAPAVAPTASDPWATVLARLGRQPRR
jgi:uncharacterized protein (TIGR03086 family)